MHPKFSFIWTFFLNLVSVFNYQNDKVHATSPGNISERARIHPMWQKPTGVSWFGLWLRLIVQNLPRCSVRKLWKRIAEFVSKLWRLACWRCCQLYWEVWNVFTQDDAPLSHREFQAALLHEAFQQIILTNQFSLQQVLTWVLWTSWYG